MTSDIREFVTNCYREILIREPDIDGLKYYVEKIQNGEISLEQFPTIMRESKEYKDELENNEKNLEKRKNQQIEYREKLQEVRYGDISVIYTGDLSGGGEFFGQDFIPIVKDLFGTVSRICEFGCGPGFIGFSLLAQGLCESLCLIDVNPKAVKICHETIKKNKLENKVSVYLSDGLSNIPSSEKWDLVVSNPPNLWNSETMTTPILTLRSVDPDWNIHKQFYANIEKFLKPDGSVLFIENTAGSMPRIHTKIITESNLEVVDCFWDWEFNSSDSTFKEFGRQYYYKKILKQIFDDHALFYFVLSKKSQKETKKIPKLNDYKTKWKSEGKIPIENFSKEIEHLVNKNH